MKRPGEYGQRDGGAPKRQFGSSGPSYGKGRQDSFGSRDGAPRQARGDRPERGGFDRGERGGFGGGGSERGGFDRGPSRGGFDRNDRGGDRGGERGGYNSRPERGGYDKPRSFERSDRPEPRSFGPNNGQSYRREGGASGGYGRPSRPAQGGFDSFTPAAAPSAGKAPQTQAPVPANKLKEGVAQANKALAGLVEQFGNTISGEYDISQLEATVSFDRDGRFMGFGEGGAVSFSLTITPLEAEDVFAQDEDLEDDADVEMEETPVAALSAQAMGEDEDEDEMDDDDIALDDEDEDEDDAEEDDEDEAMDASSATPSHAADGKQADSADASK